jgi:gamma-glutamyltranspeptidase/glutathione hydrolase
MQRTLRNVLLVLLLAACSRGAPLPETPPVVAIPAAWRFQPQAAQPFLAQRAMVVSEHPLSSEVGADIMQRGGNAIDAAVAVAFAQAVVNPRAGNIGGGGFLVYRERGGRVHTLDFREKAPAGATRNMFIDARGNVTEASQIGHLAAGVPGSVAGLAEMHRRFGRLPWRDLVEPAIRIAREGHEVDSARAEFIADNAERLRRFPATAAIFLPGGRPLARGAPWRQADLARTLELIRDSGAAGFYRGPVAGLIVAEMRRGRGLITLEDLAAYRPAWREPIRVDYRGWTIWSMPPTSSGGVTMAIMFNILAGYDRLPPFGSAELLHLQVEAMRRAFADRNRWLGDPDHVEIPLARLLSRAWADSLRRGIDLARATPSSSLPALPGGSGAGSGGGETMHYSIVDPDGNAASVTSTINDSFGNAVVVRGAGFLLNNEMDDFSARPGMPNMYGLVQGEANAIAPNRRMLSAMTPAIVVNPRGRLELVLGAPGGPRIITSVFQVISNVIDQRMTLAQAVYAPRIHHQTLPDSIRWERDGVPPEARARLEAMGHRFTTWPAGRRLCATAPAGATIGCTNAVVEAIRITPRGIEGVADPRIPGGAAGF